ncbi:MAG: transglycosylase SLT domain-containing protein [Gammaproteobacteria bacterium]|nr:transglycosylase SLT domain-containing protein [Gammaproteobacteria bacterium]
MQNSMSVSKSVVLAVLSCSLFLAIFGDKIDAPGLVSTVAYENANTKAALALQPTTNMSTSPIAKPVPKPVGSIWDSLSPELKLDHQVQLAQVQSEIRKLLADKDKLNSILKSAGPYIYFIHEQTKARGLPAELALIPVIESEFNPNDHSNKGATGLWQMMPQTARELGIKIRDSYDGRRNVVASTKAALAYFKDLGQMFNGNWYLAIAAYNCGQVKVASAEHRTGSHSFWNLKLPQETKVYVPKLLAVAEIVKHPEKYGVRLPPINNAPYFAEVKVKKTMNLSKVLEVSGVTPAALRTLNPDFNHGVVVNKGTYTSLLVPVKNEPLVRAQLADRVIVS